MVLNSTIYTCSFFNNKPELERVFEAVEASRGVSLHGHKRPAENPPCYKVTKDHKIGSKGDLEK